MASKEEMSKKVAFSGRGMCHLPLGGRDRTLRCRTHELTLLEARRGRGILAMLNEEQLGLGFIRDSILVLVAHEFRGAKGKSSRVLNEELVNGWIDECDGQDGRLSFEELTEAVIKTIVGGMPGGQAYLDSMGDGEEEGGDSPPADAPPVPASS